VENNFKKAQNYLYILLILNNLFVPPSYWILVYPIAPNQRLSFVNFSFHGVSAILFLLDVFGDSFNINRIDILIVNGYIWGYLCWVYVFHSLTGFWIYPIFDPKKIPWIQIIITLVVLMSIMMIGYFIVKLLMFLKLILFGFVKKQLRNVLWKQEEIAVVEDEVENLI
jgi:hypothetical protein